MLGVHPVTSQPGATRSTGLDWLPTEPSTGCRPLGLNRDAARDHRPRPGIRVRPWTPGTVIGGRLEPRRPLESDERRPVRATLVEHAEPDVVALLVNGGQEIRIGNFSIIPHQLLKRIVVVSEIWNHYSSGILKARIPHQYIPTDRSNRMAGSSRMNYVQLVVHGLSAISIYGDVIGVRALMATLMLALISVVLIIIAIVIRSTTDLAIPGWATYVIGLSFIILLQSFTISFSFVFLILNGRNNYSFLPQRDYQYFVLDVQRVFPKK